MLLWMGSVLPELLLVKQLPNQQARSRVPEYRAYRGIEATSKPTPDHATMAEAMRVSSAVRGLCLACKEQLRINMQIRFLKLIYSLKVVPISNLKALGNMGKLEFLMGLD